jgi:hypothetical protein
MAVSCCARAGVIQFGGILPVERSQLFLGTARSRTFWRERSVEIWIFQGRKSFKKLIEFPADSRKVPVLFFARRG